MGKLTELQRKEFKKNLRTYKKRYLKEDFKNLDESGTRIMVNWMLSNVLGYEELTEIRTEHMIKGGYADYVIQVDHKQYFVVEVKSIQLELTEKHLKQASMYAANEGIDWIILINGRDIELYRVLFEKPLRTKLVFKIDLSDSTLFNEHCELLENITRKCATTGEIEVFWKRHTTLTPKNLSDLLYSKEMINCLRKLIKKEVGISFENKEIFNSIHELVVNSVDKSKPKYRD